MGRGELNADVGSEGKEKEGLGDMKDERKGRKRKGKGKIRMGRQGGRGVNRYVGRGSFSLFESSNVCIFFSLPFFR